jgi:hypothetical protein
VDGWRKASARANALITKRHLTTSVEGADVGRDNTLRCMFNN